MRARVTVLAAALLLTLTTGCGVRDLGPGRVSPSPGGRTTGPPATIAPPTGHPKTTHPRSSGAGNPSTTGPRGTGQSGATAGALDPARAALNRMSEAQRIGQLFMVDCPSAGMTDATASALRDYRVGSVILDGNSWDGASAIADITGQLQQLASQSNPRGGKLFIATDQEGGQVQRLNGDGFSQLPSALQQGAIGAAQLTAQASDWGRQLAAAGVNVNLAPVLDTVPNAAFAPQNPPIGALDRQFGYDPTTVSAHGVAVTKGLAQAHVAATLKHFPGLGRVSANTDTTAGVTDTQTTRDDPYLAPFKAGIAAGAPFVMVSTAIYTRIDPSQPAAFSRTVITGMLRGDLRFSGVVISDDLGAAQAVSGYGIGERAVDFIAAGGDIVLTVDATQIPAMTAAVAQRARTDPAFRAQVDSAALRVLEAKAAMGLL
ncbi:MAG: glycoside hydrolase family 3 protein [Actinomycetia bacterium]|nr:glycoside hydrolase family 3 protein [Actinomycetes bacterium]